MRKRFTLVSCCLLCMMAAPVYAQQIDLGFGGGSLASSGNSVNSGNFLPGEGGGAFVGFNGDVLFWHHVGVQGELNWRASQGLYGGQIPFRPLFWDFNAIYFRRFNKAVGAEALAGIGGESIRFYSSSYNCDIYGNCTSYVSSNHFMGDVGAGVRLYVWHNLFVRPELRLYLVHNNAEFSSSYPVHYGVSIGYTFGGSN